MNWIIRLLSKEPPKSGYTILWETIDKMPQGTRETVIKKLVQAYMPGNHIQGSYKGKKP